MPKPKEPQAAKNQGISMSLEEKHSQPAKLTSGVLTGLQGRGFFGGGSLAWETTVLVGTMGDLLTGGGGLAGLGSLGREGMEWGAGRRGWTTLTGWEPGW